MCLVMALIGIGLLVFGLTALANSRATDQEAIIVEKALTTVVRNLHQSTADGLSMLLRAPGRFLSACLSFIISAVSFPFRMIVEAGHFGASNIGYGLQWLGGLPSALLRGLLTLLGKMGKATSNGVTRMWTAIVSVVSTSFLGPIYNTVAWVAGAIASNVSSSYRSIETALVALNESILKASTSVLTQFSNIFDVAGQSIGNLFGAISNQVESMSVAAGVASAALSTQLYALVASVNQLSENSKILFTYLWTKASSSDLVTQMEPHLSRSVESTSAVVQEAMSWCMEMLQSLLGKKGDSRV